ncbi:MAG: hypothetical protein ACOYJB_02730 [Christensenellaceae bacterium]
MNGVGTQAISRGSIVGIGVCPKCNVINKVRNGNAIVENKCKCIACGTEIAINKLMMK